MALFTNLHELYANALRRLFITQDRELTWCQTKIDQLTKVVDTYWYLNCNPELMTIDAECFHRYAQGELA